MEYFYSIIKLLEKHSYATLKYIMNYINQEREILTLFSLRITAEIKFIPEHLKTSSIVLLPASCTETCTTDFMCGIITSIETSVKLLMNVKQSSAWSGLVVDRASITSNTRGIDCEYACNS